MADTRGMYSVRLDTEQAEQIDRIAATEGLNRSDMIRRLIAEALVRRERTRPFTGLVNR